MIGDGSLVFASGTGGSGSAGNPFIFPSTITKQGNKWNDTEGVFTTREAHSLYFIGLSVGVPDTSPADFTMVLSKQRYAGITRTSTTHNRIEMIARDVIAELYAAETLQVSNGHSVVSADSQDTSITIFSISNSMNSEPVAFSAVREDTLSGSADPVPFNVILYNSGLHFDMFSYVFTAPSSGVYYFSFSVGLISEGKARFTLYKNDEHFADILRESTTHTGTDTIGRSVMMELEADDFVHIGNPAGYTARSSELKETSFCGFKYEPKHGNQVRYHKMRISCYFSPDGINTYLNIFVLISLIKNIFVF